VDAQVSIGGSDGDRTVAVGAGDGGSQRLQVGQDAGMRVAEGVVGSCADDGQARVDGVQEFGCGGAGPVMGDLEDVGAEGNAGAQQ
jgi:hypothetical protein